MIDFNPRGIFLALGVDAAVVKPFYRLPLRSLEVPAKPFLLVNKARATP